MSTSIEIFPLPLLKKNSSNELLRCLDVVINIKVLSEHQACLTAISLKNENRIQLEGLSAGENRREIFIPEVTSEEEIVFIFKYGNENITSRLLIKPARKWEIYLLLHSHTDLGFTAAISDVAQIHNDNTDLAVLYCQETENWPEGSRFKWTCEVSWQLQNYLKDRNEYKVNLLLDQLHKRNIEAGALYTGELTEILGHEQAVRSFYYAAKLRRDYNIPIDTAMLCDVPGCTKGFIQIMAKSGINNFILADNNFIAPFLSRTDLPRPFFWSGDDNSKVLAWYTDHPYYAYIEGKNYGLSDSYSESRKKLPYKLLSLEQNGYAYNEFQLQYAFDNFRIEFRPAAIVREWNENWEYPKLKLSTAGEFLRDIRKKYNNIPVVKGDWTNWWSGIVSGFPDETAKSRYLHNKIPALEIISSAVMMNSGTSDFPSDEFNELYDQTLAFDEHSGSGMIWEAGSAEEKHKALLEGYGYIHNAAIKSSELEKDKTKQLASLFNVNSENFLIGVFNPLNFKRGGFVKSRYVNSGEFSLKDKNSSSRIPVEINKDYTRFYAEDVPPLGIKLFEVVPEEHTEIPVVSASKKSDKLIIENNFFKITACKKEAKILSVYNKVTETEILKDSLGVPVVYEPKPTTSIEMGKYKPEIYNGDEFPGEVKPLPADCTSEIRIVNDKIFGSVIQVISLADKKEWLTQNVFLKEGEIHIVNTIEGKSVYNPAFLKNYLSSNGMLYFLFNFNIEEGRIRYDAPCSVIEPGKEIFNGSCKDYSAIQNWLQIHNDSTSINFFSIDAPLIDAGNIALMKYRRDFPSAVQDLYVRALSLNEFNIKNKSPYSDNPDLMFRFVISVSPPELLDAYKTGESLHSELISFVVPPGNGILNIDQFRFIEVLPEHIKVMTIKKAESGEGLIIRVRETAGINERIELKLQGKNISAAFRCMMTEEILEEVKVSDGRLTWDIGPFGIETFNIHYE
jgi:alpha-mannosidase